MEDDPGDPNDDDSLETSDGGLVGAGRADTLRLAARGGEGTATVTLSWTNPSKVEVREGSTVLSTPASWSVADLPDSLTVEGLVASDAHGDVEFTLKYDDLPTCLDKVNMTVAETDLDIDTDNDGTVEDDADDPDEDESPGHVLMVNWDNDNNDDDNGDGTIDNDDRDCDDHLWETGDDDCSELVLRLDPDDLPDAHKVTLTLDDPSLIRVFDDGNNAILGPFTEVDAAGNPGPSVTEWEKELSAISLPASDLTFHIEGVEPGVSTLTLTYYTDTDLEIHSDEVKAAVLPPPLVPDYDRDGEIADIDSSRAVGRETFHFWINDDNDHDIDSGVDAPVGSAILYPDADYRGGYIDGERDLLDFFPVLLDLASVLQQYPAADYTYKLLHETITLPNAPDDCGNLNVLFNLGLERSNVNRHIFDQAFVAAHAGEQINYHIGHLWGGSEIPESVLTNIAAGNDTVMLLEAHRASTNDLSLNVVRNSDNSVVMAFDLPLRLSTVEHMYRHINLRNDGCGQPEDTSPPAGFPDSLCTSDKNVFYVHGVNQDGPSGRCENADMFKRLYWAGSRAKYWAVQWQSDDLTRLNYQHNVNNALTISSSLASKVTTVPNKVFVAHSLGNIATSAAIQDHNMVADRYILLNGAVACESYEPSTFDDSTTADNDMLHHLWRGYNSNTLSATWQQLFESVLGDQRAKLTWKNRFPSIGPPFAFNDYGLNQDEINELLAKGIPALSPPMGRGIEQWDDNDPADDANVDMETLKTGWGRDHPEYGNSWLHGDWKKMAFIHTHKLFELIVEEGDLR